MSDIILESLNIRKGFGGVVALDNLTFLIARNTITAIIGPNGAGKTTLLNVVSGMHAPDRGTIFLNQKTISGLKPHEITRCGLARTFQTAQIFGNMTVLENVMVGRHVRTRAGILSSALRLPRMRREEPVTCERARFYLEMVGLQDIADKPAASIPIGSQRLLEIARALATEPEILLLDEPAAGLNTQETRQLGTLIRAIKELGITVVIVEHDMELVMDISDEIIVLNYGKRIAEGKPVEIQTNQEVIDVYLGKEE
ncbi:MAG: ABC transporter ATP-binding protein [Proteobacteria bacterium]|nr:ABC transporter ATP-binding protein [Pseudomonadota bacterium]